MWFSFPWRIWTANIPWTVSSLLHFSCWLLNKEPRLGFHDVPHVPETNPHPFLFTVLRRTSFYDNPVPFCKCRAPHFLGFEPSCRASICSMIYTERRSTQSSGGRNRFRFQIKQQANKTEENKLQHSLLGPAYSCCSFVTSYMRPEAFLLFLITIYTHVPTDPPATPPPHWHAWSQWPWVLSMPTQCNLHLPSLNERERRSSSTPLATSDPPQCGSLAMADFQRGSAIRI